MKRKDVLKKMLFVFLLFPLVSIAQGTIKGIVIDGDGQPLAGANVVVKGTATGTITDFDGNFTLNVDELPLTLLFSSLGYDSSSLVVNSYSQNIKATLNEGVELDEVIILGNRAKPRTILDSPVPVDNIGVAELQNSGKPTIDRMLTFKVPSFNSQNQAISDATAHYDPADLRGLGPSRTLVLVNGKRKNQSAQVYLNRTPGKGEVGIDLKSIPAAAVERVEVLRDGASAQYGSDAIAGVINMVLKKNVEYSTISARAGLTSQGDGFNSNIDLNTSFNFGEGGFVNLTLSHYTQKITNRAGKPGVNDLPSDARPNEILWAIDNPDLGMHVGQPEMKKSDVFVNLAHPIGEKAELYSFHGFTSRTGKSFAYYRAPYWRRDVADSGFLTLSGDFQGYQPTFETEIKDNINALGLRFELGEDFNGDASITYGGNSVFYTVNNSVNRDYLADNGNSPRTFEPGGYKLNNLIGNLDFSKLFSEQIAFSFGAEIKRENFEAIEGDERSYYKGGSDSFAGIKPAEVVDVDRTSVAGYVGLDYDITEALLLGVAARYEDFSDFGNNFSWKINGRYKIGDNGAVRGSYSTGFRAPTLHQRYLTNSQYIIVAGSSEPLLQGTLANDNSAVKALGVPSLFAETSKNISVGLTYKINRKFSASVDLYQIKVDDRVLFSSQIGSDGDDTTTNAVEQILQDNNVVAVQFFINAGDTKTTGLDLVLNYKNVELGEGRFGVSLAANFNKTEIDAISTPDQLAQNGYNIFAREEKALITDARPKFKIITGLTYDLNKLSLGLNNTIFGQVTIVAPEGSNGIDQELSPTLVTDFNISYKLTDRLSLNGILNNIFDVYPDKTLASTQTAQAATRFTYSSEVQQHGLMGMNYSLGLNYRF